MNDAHLIGRLRRAKLRFTFSRLKVLEMLFENPGFLGADEIHGWLLERSIPVSIASVYRALREMRGAGFVLSLRDASGALRYCLKPETPPPSLHLVCRDNGDHLSFSDPELHAQILAAAAREGLRLEGREFELHVRLERQGTDSGKPGRHVQRG